MKPFVIKEHFQPSALEKLLKKVPEKNFLIDVNNLLAQFSLAELNASQITSIESSYGIKDSGKKYRDEFLGFISLFLIEHLGNWGSDINDYQSAEKLGRVFGLSENDFENEYRPLAKEIFKKKVFLIISLAKKINGETESQINKLVEALNLDNATSNEIIDDTRIRIVRDAFNSMIADSRVSPDEIAAYEKLSNDLNVTPQMDPTSYQILEKYKLLWKIDNGNLPVYQPDIILPKSESCHYIASAKLYETRKVTTRVNYGGPTFRLKIAKGIYYRTGSVSVSRDTQDVLTFIDSGKLFITNKRILFVGERNNKTIRYAQVIDINPYSDGIEIVKDAGKNATFQLFDGVGEILATTLARILRDNQ